MLRYLAALVTVGALASPAAAQSLGDLAKKTAADREKAKAEQAKPKDEKDDKAPAKKVYTDDDLKSLAPMPAGVVPIVEPAPPAATSPALAETHAEAADAKKDKAYWFGRMNVLLTQLDTDTIASAAADRRVAQLQAEMDATEHARDGIVYVDRIAKQQFLDARNEASRIKAAVDADRAAIAALEEEARIANVPPGWLRR